MILAGCGSSDIPAPVDVPACVTLCGLRAYDIRESCAEMQSIEDSVVEAFADMNSCQALDEIALRVARGSGPGGFEYDGQIVGGVTDPRRMQMVVADVPLRTGGILVHEMVHVFDWRDNSGTTGMRHEDWEERGLLVRINVWHAAQTGL